MNSPKSNMYGVIPDSPPDLAKKPVSAQAESAGYQQIRESLFTPDACLFKQLDYCVRDPDFIDPLIKEVLDKYYDGVVPSQADKLTEVKNSVFAKYRNALYATDGLRRVEKLLEQRFQSPIKKEEGTTVSIDFGVLPGKLAVGARSSIGIAESSHLTDGEWSSAEIGQLFKKYHAEFPRAHALRLIIQLPSRIQSSEWIYHYSVADDRIIVLTGGSPSRGLATPTVLGRTFDPYIKGEKSLHSKNLIHVRLSEFKL